MHGLVNGAIGLVEVWLDGSLLGDLSGTRDLGSLPVGRVQIGELYAGGRTYDVVFDDVAFNTTYVAP